MKKILLAFVLLFSISLCLAQNNPPITSIAGSLSGTSCTFPNSPPVLKLSLTDGGLVQCINGTWTLLPLTLDAITLAQAAASGGYIELYEGSNNGTNKLKFSAPSSITSDGTCTLLNATTNFIPQSCVEKRVEAECFTVYTGSALTASNFMSVWKAPAAVTVTKISCESTHATDITINLNKDNNCDTAAMSTTNMESGDLQCGTTMTDGVVVTAGNEDHLAAGDCVDLEIVASTSSTKVTVCMEYSYD